MSSDRYQLIDFGDGRKLESLAGYLIDRPSVAAQHAQRHDRRRWEKPDARYDGRSKTWDFHTPWPADLDVDCGSFRMPVRPTPYGHIGIFPEQESNWRWLGKNLSDKNLSCEDSNGPKEKPQALNLFGYTGASTMALIAAGYSVAHVDAAKPNVQAVRMAAQHNRRAEAAIRYLVDDAAKFAAREVRRGRKYHTIVLDPPAYGHSPKGKAWRLSRDLWPLLQDCLALLDPADFRLLVTGHSAEVGTAEVTGFLEQSKFLCDYGGASGLRLESGRSQLKDKLGRSLDAGFFVRAQRCRS